MQVLEKGGEDSVIQSYLDTLKNYVHHSGGFSIWPHGRYDSPYVTTYAIFAMLRAKERGFRVDDKTLKAALGYLKNIVRQSYKKSKKYKYPWSYYACVSGLALEVLAEAKMAKRNWFLSLYNEKGVPLFGRAALMRAMHVQGGFESQVRALRAQLDNSIKMESGTARIASWEAMIDAYEYHLLECGVVAK